MSAKCSKHPRAPAGECWECEGKPPDWTCPVCGRRVPCAHVQQVPALTKASAMTRSDLMRAIELYRAGSCDWAYVEHAIDRHEQADRSAWRKYRGERSVS